MTLSKITFSTITLGAALLLGACQSGGGAGAGRTPGEPEGVVHQVTAQDMALVHSKTALTKDHAVLWVNGLGCPQCATNIDRALENVKGVQSVQVDLSSGKVTVGLNAKGAKPSPHQLSEAVIDAGLTLVKIEQE